MHKIYQSFEKREADCKDMEDNILTDGAIKKMTLNTLFERYMETRELADTTRVSYVRAWENRVKDEIGNIKVVQLLPSHIKGIMRNFPKLDMLILQSSIFITCFILH